MLLGQEQEYKPGHIHAQEVMGSKSGDSDELHELLHVPLQLLNPLAQLHELAAFPLVAGAITYAVTVEERVLEPQELLATAVTDLIPVEAPLTV